MPTLKGSSFHVFHISLDFQLDEGQANLLFSVNQLVMSWGQGYCDRYFPTPTCNHVYSHVLFLCLENVAFEKRQWLVARCNDHMIYHMTCTSSAPPQGESSDSQNRCRHFFPSRYVHQHLHETIANIKFIYSSTIIMACCTSQQINLYYMFQHDFRSFMTLSL